MSAFVQGNSPLIQQDNRYHIPRIFHASSLAREILLQQHPHSGGRPKARFHTKWCPKPGNMTSKVVRDAIDERLDRLGVESVDLLQFHWWTYQHPGYLDAIEGLMLAHQSGRIANIGLTNFNVDHLWVLLGQKVPIVSNQVVVSMLDQRALEEMTDVAMKHNVKLLAYGVLAGGFLSETMAKTNPSPEIQN